jgi:hypothetical protein
MPSRRTAARLLLAALASLPLAAPPTPASAGEIIVDHHTFIEVAVTPGPESAIGTPITAAVHVWNDSGDTPEGGVVELFDGDEPTGLATLDAAGRASLTYVPPTVGIHELSVVFHGHPPSFMAASSHPVEHTVTGDPPHVPEVELTVSPEARAPGGSTIVLTATIDEAVTDPRIRGTVAFRVGRFGPFGSADLVVEGGTATAQVELDIWTGVHQLTARYGGALPEIGPSTSAAVTYSGLPETCADQAVPGNGALVRLAYQAILGRCPDAPGFTYWTDRLDAGTPASVFGRALALSSEGIAATVDTAYRQVLGRPSDPTGRAVWAAKLRAGWTTSQLWAALADSPEFAAGADGPLVDHVFARLVGRPVDAPSRAYWTERLSRRPLSGALRALVLTPEALGHIVDDIYRAVLGRDGLGSQHGAQTTIKARRGDWRTMGAELVDQAHLYAQSYPDPAG